MQKRMVGSKIRQYPSEYGSSADARLSYRQQMTGPARTNGDCAIGCRNNPDVDTNTHALYSV